MQTCRALDDLTTLYLAFGALNEARPTVAAVGDLRAEVVGVASGVQDLRSLLQEVARNTASGSGGSGVVRLDGVDARAVGEDVTGAVEVFNQNFWYLAGLLCGLAAGAQMLRRMLP